MEPPRARGTGRSGPRRRTGCLTCRSRKVRCDEAKPQCANCTRLRLGCAYDQFFFERTIPRRRSRTATVSEGESPGTGTGTGTSGPPLIPADSPATVSVAETSTIETPGRTFLDSVLRADEQRRQEFGTGDNAGAPGLTGPFDMLGFIGEITSELGQKQLNILNGVSDFISPTVQSMGTLNGSPGDQRTTSVTSSSINGGIPTEITEGNHSEAPEVTALENRTQATYEEQLLMHFLEIESLPTIFGPVNMEWKYARSALLSQALDFNPLLNAVYCYADVLKAMMEGKRWRLAPTYHQRASLGIQECILGDVDESTLKRVFATVFLLMLSELLSFPDLCRPGTSFLHSAYLLLRRFLDRTKSWTGLSHLTVSWVSLLDVKALIAGREGDPLIELGQLSEPDMSWHADNSGLQSARAKEPDDDKDLLSRPGYLICDAVAGPVFRFYVQLQQVSRRIIYIDLHHRSRGTLNDEFEVLQIAHKVGADLETIWNRRPRVLDVYDKPEELFDTLSPPVAVELCRTFRQYVANFLASFIYLHRVAFAIYPRTDRVHGAVNQIIQLARAETAQQEQGNLLQMSFIWPLFVAGLEGSLEQRGWIIQEMRRVAENAAAPQQRHPNATQALMLLEEMTRRQDESRTGADSRCVRRELFADPFVMI